MPRPKSSICNVPGCGQPRLVNRKGVQLTRCESHMRQYWREHSANNRRAVGDPGRDTALPCPPGGEVCHFCHRTPAEAAAFLALGIRCTVCVPASLPLSNALERGPGGEDCLIIDAVTNTLTLGAFTVASQQPVPDAGARILRRHLVTGVTSDGL